MKAYIVTAGDYSAYHIEKVFTDPVQAQMYANLDADMQVEEFPVDDVQITDSQTLKVNVVYDFDKDEITSMVKVDYEWNEYDPEIAGSWYTTFHFCAMLSGKLFQDVAQNGMRSTMLLKVARDKFYTELDKTDQTKRTLLDKKHKMKEAYERQYSRYPMYKTSLETSNPVEAICTQEVSDKLDEMYKNGEPLPDVMTLVKMIKESREKNAGGNNIG